MLHNASFWQEGLLDNPIISQIQFFMTSHFSTLLRQEPPDCEDFKLLELFYFYIFSMCIECGKDVMSYFAGSSSSFSTERPLKMSVKVVDEPPFQAWIFPMSSTFFFQKIQIM